MTGHASRRAVTGFVVGFLGVALVGLTARTARAQACDDALIMSQMRPWEFRPNASFVLAGVPRAAVAAIFRNTDAYRQMFVAAYPEGRGGLIRGSGVVLDPSVFMLPGLVPYSYTASFYPYWCKSRSELVTNPAFLTVNSAQVAANDLRYVIEDIAGDYEFEGRPVKLFRLAHTKGTLGGLTVYEPFAYDGSSAVVLSHDGQLPYRPLTQREYLTAVKAHWEKELAKEAGVPDEQEREIRAQMEEVKKDLTGDVLDATLKGLNAQLAAMSGQRQAMTAALAEMREQEIVPIDRYLATTSASELQRVAVPKAPGHHRGFITEQEGGHQVVVLDETYIKKAMPRQAAQVLVVYWYNDPHYVGSRLFRERIDQAFPFDQLKAMVDR